MKLSHSNPKVRNKMLINKYLMLLLSIVSNYYRCQYQEPSKHNYYQNLYSEWNRIPQVFQKQQRLQPINTKEFITEMCRERKYSMDWETILSPCKRNLEFSSEIYSKGNRTNATYSLILNRQIKETGEYSSFSIKTFNDKNEAKTIGGDTIRVFINGNASMESFVYDMGNGVYETSFLLMESGEYIVDVILTGSLCSAYVNPPNDWFRKGDYNGHFQSEWSYGNKDGWPYLLTERIWERIRKFKIYVQPGNQGRINDNLNSLKNWKDICKFNKKCQFLSEGFGRWIGRTWKPYTNSVNIPSGRRKRKTNEGTLWTYGDCYAYHLYEEIWNKTLCLDVFKQCKKTYNWVYPRTNVNAKLDKTVHLKTYKDLNIDWLVTYLENVLKRKDMFGVQHGMVLNFGLHFVRSASFQKYKELIDKVVTMMKKYPIDIVWRTTTAIYRPEHKTHKRFQTYQRALLFNAYSISAMCDAGIPIIDVFPITSSYPYKPTDGIHFSLDLFKPMIDTLEKYYRTVKVK